MRRKTQEKDMASKEEKAKKKDNTVDLSSVSDKAKAQVPVSGPKAESPEPATSKKKSTAEKKPRKPAKPKIENKNVASALRLARTALGDRTEPKKEIDTIAAAFANGERGEQDTITALSECVQTALAS
jgi:hypothetical protein